MLDRYIGVYIHTRTHTFIYTRNEGIDDTALSYFAIKVLCFLYKFFLFVYRTGILISKDVN